VLTDSTALNQILRLQRLSGLQLLIKHKQNRKLIYFYVSLLVETAGFAKNKTNLFLAENWEKLCQDNLCFYTDDNNNSSERTDSDSFVLPEAFFGFV